MTVAELIEALRALPPDAEVMVDGYEGGVGPASAPKLIRVKRNANSSWYYGPHEEVTDPNEADDGAAVLISGGAT